MTENNETRQAVRKLVLLSGTKTGIITGSNMKTAISIDDGLLKEVDEAAQKMGLSRSRLFALAVGDFLRRRQREEMLLRLNEVYGNGLDPTEKTLVSQIKTKASPAVKERW